MLQYAVVSERHAPPGAHGAGDHLDWRLVDAAPPLRPEARVAEHDAVDVCGRDPSLGEVEGVLVRRAELAEVLPHEVGVRAQERSLLLLRAAPSASSSSEKVEHRERGSL